MKDGRKRQLDPPHLTRRHFFKLSSAATALSALSLPVAGSRGAGVLADEIHQKVRNREETTTVVPVEIDGPIANPYMGWGLWAGAYNDFTAARYGQPYTLADNTTRFGDDAPLFNWVMLDWPWDKVEPVEGKFEWDEFDAIIKYWSARGKQFVVRFWVSEDPGWNGHPGEQVVPSWIWKKGVRYLEYAGEGGVKRREPDYADPSYKQIYLPALSNLLRSFAAQYDRVNTPVALLQVMGYGAWADWATWYSHYKFPSLEAKHEILGEIMYTYISIFKHIRLMEMAAGDWDHAEMKTLKERMYSKALDIAVAHKFALIWTGFIDGLGDRWDHDEMEEYWRRDPIVAEGNWCYQDMKAQKIHGTPIENLDVALDWHANYSHFYTDAIAYKLEMAQDRTFLEHGLDRGGLGYRLVPTSLTWPSALPAGNLLVFRQRWVNRNVGRLYEWHPLKLYLTDPNGGEEFGKVDISFDERQWIRGETYSMISVFQLPKNLAPGFYDVRIALVDETGKPRIALGIEGRDSEGRYKVGEIEILPYDGPAG